LTLSVIGYVVMRIAGVTQWIRAARSDPEHRPTAIRYVVGTVLSQAAWVSMIFLPKSVHLLGFVVLALVELLIPVWAETASPNTLHAPHIRERFGLFTLIVLGESILSTSTAIRSASDTGGMSADLITVIFGGLLIVYAMWWLYFYQPPDHLLASLRDRFIWAYGHLLVFGATAMVGAGLAIVIDQVTHHAKISASEANLAVTLPIAIYVLSLWVIHEHSQARNQVDRLLHPVTVLLIVLTSFTGQAVLLTGILLVILVVVRLVRHLE
jgi:low temperature requirement protein LtrA